MSRERRKIVAYMRARLAEMATLAKRSERVTAYEASMLKRRIEALADEIEQGMHL